MPRGRKNPTLGKPAPQLPPCKVCGEQGTGFHYGVTTCGACKGFFRRSITRTEPYMCTESGHCSVGPETARRKSCSKCRYEKCLAVGMSKDAIKTGRYSYEKKSKDVLELLTVRADKLVNPTTSSHEKPQNERNIGGRGKESFKSANTSEESYLPTAPLRNEETYSSYEDTLEFCNNTPDENHQKLINLHASNMLSELPKVLSLRCLAYTYVNDDLKRAIKRKIEGNKEKLVETEGEVTKLTNDSDVLKYTASHNSQKRQALPQTLKQSSPNRQISPSRYCLPPSSVRSETSGLQQTPTNVNLVQAATASMTGVGPTSTYSYGPQSSRSLGENSEYVEMNISSLTKQCASQLSVDVTSHDSNSSHDVVYTPNNIPDVMTNNRTAWLSPFQESALTQCNSLRFLSLHQKNDARYSQDVVSTFINQNSLYTDHDHSMRISSVQNDRDTLKDKQCTQRILNKKQTPPFSTSVNPDIIPNLTNYSDGSGNSSKSNTHMLTSNNDLILGRRFSPDLIDLSSFDSLATRHEPSNSTADEFPHTSVENSNWKYRTVSSVSPDGFSNTREHCNEISGNPDSNKDQSSILESIVKELPSPYLEELHIDATKIINDSTEEFLRLTKDLSEFGLYSYELTLLRPLFEQINISFTNDAAHQSSKTEISGQSKPPNTVYTKHAGLSQTSDLPQSVLFPNSPPRLKIGISQPINHDPLPWCEFSEVVLQEITSSLVTSHAKHIGKDNNCLTQEQITKKMELYLRVCQLKQKVFGKAKRLRDRDKYFNILKTTGIDIDGSKEYTNISVKMFNEYLYKVVSFIKTIPGFKKLCQEDKITLCKCSILTCFILGSFQAFDFYNNIFIFDFNLAESRDEWEDIQPEIEVVNKLLENMTRRIKAMNLTVEEIIVLKAVCITSPDVDGLEDRKAVESLHWQLLCCLLLSLHRRHPRPFKVYTQIITLLADFMVYSAYQWSFLENVKFEYNELTDYGLDAPLYKEIFLK